MSWDVFIQHLPAHARRVAEIPDEYQGQALGMRDEVIRKIESRFPDADFSDPSWGRLIRDDYAIEISISDEEIVTGVTLHIRGSDGAVDAVKQMIDVLGARGLDSWTGEIFDPDAALHSIRRWRAYLESE